MTIAIREPSGLTEIGAIAVREASGLTAIGEVWVRDETNTLVQVFGSLAVTITPSIIFGSTNSHGSIVISTGYVTAATKPTGAVDSVHWSTSDIGWSATNPTSLTTAFRSPPVAAGSDASATFICTITRGGNTASKSVTAEVTNYGT